MNGILARMKRDAETQAPHPIAHAMRSAILAIRRDVKARISDGSLIIN